MSLVPLMYQSSLISKSTHFLVSIKKSFNFVIIEIQDYSLRILTGCYLFPGKFKEIVTAYLSVNAQVPDLQLRVDLTISRIM